MDLWPINLNGYGIIPLDSNLIWFPIKMKISIGVKLKSGPWGGGNSFAHSLVNFLESNGEQVFFDLERKDLDIILIFDPRRSSQSASYNEKHVLDYLLRRNRNAIVIHRVNECDERKGTNNVNKELRRANLISDHTVFVSRWLRDLHLQQGMSPTHHSVILNGANRKIFNNFGYRRWSPGERMSLVTHHWGTNWLKGFDVYEKLDSLLNDKKFNEIFDFTYIGNLPAGFKFNHANYIKPQQGTSLANTIRRHHVYITGSQNEPGSNHQNEGACCGLPLLYRISGCLAEYCSGYGIEFDIESLELALDKMKIRYHEIAPLMIHYPHTSKKMNAQYYGLFVSLLDQRGDIIKSRNYVNWIQWFLMYPYEFDRVRKHLFSRARAMFT